MVEKSFIAENARAQDIITVTKDSCMPFPEDQVSDRYDVWTFRKDSHLAAKYPMFRFSPDMKYMRIPKQVPPTAQLKIPILSPFFKENARNFTKIDLEFVVEDRVTVDLDALENKRQGRSY